MPLHGVVDPSAAVVIAVVKRSKSAEISRTPPPPLSRLSVTNYFISAPSPSSIPHKRMPSVRSFVCVSCPYTNTTRQLSYKRSRLAYYTSSNEKAVLPTHLDFADNIALTSKSQCELSNLCKRADNERGEINLTRGRTDQFADDVTYLQFPLPLRNRFSFTSASLQAYNST